MVEIRKLELPGFKLNPNLKVVDAIHRRLAKTEGICPCHHDEWDETTPEVDKLCPCKTYRDGNGCHCTLYVKDED